MMGEMTGRRSSYVLAASALLAMLIVSPAGAALGAWSNPAVATTGSSPALVAVSCVTAQFCIAAGDQQSGPGAAALVDRWNGVGWSVMSVPGPATVHSLGGISCVTTSFCMAVGTQQLGGAGSDWAPLVIEWDGLSWAVVPSPSTSETFNSLLGVSCVSATACVAVGTSAQDNTVQPLTEVWNGAVWTLASDVVSGANASFNAVSCTKASFCIAVGQSYDPVAHTHQSRFEKWDGSQWTILPSPDQSSADQIVVGVSCVSRTWCIAAGNNVDAGHVATTYKWDGTAWSLQYLLGSGPVDAAFYNVDCLTRFRCVAVGSISDSSRRKHAPPLPPLIASWNGRNWQITGKNYEPQLAASLFGVSCSSVTDCSTVGYGNGTAVGLISY